MQHHALEALSPKPPQLLLPLPLTECTQRTLSGPQFSCCSVEVYTIEAAVKIYAWRWKSLGLEGACWYLQTVWLQHFWTRDLALARQLSA